MTTLIKNAHVALWPDVTKADVLIEGETVVRVDENISAEGVDVIDAFGKYLLPGGVDVHTHFDLDLGKFRAVDDFHSGSVAAACGGTTTIVDHIGNGPAGCRLGHQIDVYHKLAKDAVVDYSFHGVIQYVDDQVLADMKPLADDGITSFKIYLTYGNKLADPDVLRVFERARELGVVICVHCENDAMIGFLTKELVDAGKREPRYHPLSRPDECEAEAVYRMLQCAHAVGDSPLYIVHTSTAQSLAAAWQAKNNGQQHVFVETCPQYLFLDDSRYDDPVEGLKYIMAPPLRSRYDKEALWRATCNRAFDVVATDHCPFNFAKEKQAGRDGFNVCPGGAPGVEARMQLLFSEGFMRNKMSLPDLVNMCCIKPAKIFGLYPKKGVIQPGADADLVLFDPDVEWTLTHADLHERVDYTPYEGMPLRGKPVMTMSRGEVIVKDGEFIGVAGRGNFIARKIPDLNAI